MTSEASAQKWSVAAYDLQTGSFIRSFKGQPVAAGCLCLQGNHTLVTVANGKPVLQLWALSRKVSFCLLHLFDDTSTIDFNLLLFF